LSLTSTPEKFPAPLSFCARLSLPLTPSPKNFATLSPIVFPGKSSPARFDLWRSCRVRHQARFCGGSCVKLSLEPSREYRDRVMSHIVERGASRPSSRTDDFP